MKISVIVTVYNRLKYLRNILLALENQIKKPYEVIIADDGSSENLNEAIKNVIPVISYKLKHVYQKDLGFRASRSRNNGARVAEGEYLIFLDQDVLMDENFIQDFEKNRKHMEFMKANAIRLDETRSERLNKEIEKNGMTYSYKRDVEKLIHEEEKEMIFKALKRDFFYTLLFKMKLRSRGVKLASLAMGVAKEDFIMVNGFDEKYIGWGHEDDDICNRFYAYGLIGRNIKLSNPIIHMWHNEDNSKKESLNEKYYVERKEIILKKREYKCEYGYKKTNGNDSYILKIIK